MGALYPFSPLRLRCKDKRSIYEMSEATTRLYLFIVGHLLRMIDRLVDRGNSVIVIEHDRAVIKNADWILLGYG